MTTQPSDMWHGIPRGDITWHPTVVSDRCSGCGLCVTSCGRGVYAFDYELNRPVVVAAERCMVGCTTCATICLQDAIDLPGSVRHPGRVLVVPSFGSDDDVDSAPRTEPDTPKPRLPAMTRPRLVADVVAFAWAVRAMAPSKSGGLGC